MAVAASATVLVSGCAQVGAQELDASQLTISAITYPTTYDPSGSEWGNRSGYYQAVFDTLLLASTEGTIEPWLATEWSYNEDNTELTLTLRDDVTFSDGSQMTGDVVAQNLLRFRDGTSPDAGYFAGIESVDAPNDTTVVINLAAPEPAMLNYLTRDPGLVASAESFDNPDIATTPVGSGPYIFDKGASVIGSSYIYTKNPNYWNPEVQHYEGLRINVISDPTAILNTVQAGEANAVRLATNDNLIPVEDAGWTLNSNELDFQGLLLLDRAGTANPALGDVKVRQAINHAMDRAGLLEALQQDAGTVTGQVFPITSDAYDPALDERYPYDPAKAKELLAEAGYADGFTLSMPSSPVLGTNTYVLLAQLLRDVGITADYTDPGNNFIADLLAPKFPASFMALEQNPDWQLIQFMIGPNAIFNPYKYEDPQITEWMGEMQFADEAGQDAIAKQINEYIVEEAWFAPWYRVKGVMASDPDTEVTMTPSNAFPNIYDIKPKS